MIISVEENERTKSLYTKLTANYTGAASLNATSIMT